MKYQTFAVIFIAIILPLSMVLSFYIQMQSDIIALETKYESKLNNATYAAVSAYQMNSLNTQRVAGESILNYVEASVNTFHTTLATSMLQSNASKTLFRPYIPAILFTTYDGYYIYSPYKAATAAVIQIEDSIEHNELAGDNGQTILSKDKEVVYMSNATNQNYRIKDSGTVTSLKDQISDSIHLPGTYTTRIDEAKMDYSYKLKPFIYYSCRYKSGNKDFVASYSLDNYLTVYGIIGNTSFSKSGYAINPDDVTITGDFLVKLSQRGPDKVSLASFLTYDNNGSINPDSIATYYNDVKADGSSKSMKFKRFDQSNIKYFIDDYTYRSGALEREGDYYYAQVSNNPKDIQAVSSGTNLTRFQTGDNIIEDTINLQEAFKKHKADSGYDPEQNDPWDGRKITIDGTEFQEIEVKYKGLKITDPDAKKYYIKAKYFSEWMDLNLGNIKEGDAIENKGIKDVISNPEDSGFYDDFTGSNTLIFNFRTNGNDPSSELSPFFVHKTSIIKNSIQQNLNAAISNFNEDRRVSVDSEYTYRMPVLNSSDWDNILNNVCMVSFLQGIPTGNNRTFNSYAIVKSTNNNTFVTPDNLCFTEEIGVDEEKGDYHKLDCPKLGRLNDQIQELIGDRSAEFKYDALRINSLVDAETAFIDESTDIIAFEDDTTHTFYKAIAKPYTDINGESKTEWTLGDKIDDPSKYDWNSKTYNLNDNAAVTTSPLVKYLFDHKNMACYDCIISGNHDSCVKYYDGDLYLTAKVPDTGEIIIRYKDNKWLNLNGTEYTGTVKPTKTVLEEYGCGTVNTTTLPIGTGANELNKRRQALFNMLGKYKETQYKSNNYINR